MGKKQDSGVQLNPVIKSERDLIKQDMYMLSDRVLI